MSDTTTINAEIREDVGKGASRRLRREGKVPAVIYGGHTDPVTLTVSQQELLHATENESFFASILEIKVGKDRKQQAVVRDMHRHPYKPVIMHIDFMRVSAEEVLRISVPVHFAGYPCEMDPICDIAQRHGLKIIEDCAHACNVLTTRPLAS